MEDKGKKTEEGLPPSGENETICPKPLTTLTLLSGSSEDSELQQQKPDSVNHGDLTATTDQPVIHDSEMKLGVAIDLNLEDKKQRSYEGFGSRIISNRNSAQKSRTRKLQHIRELEQKAKELEIENSVLRICIDSEKKVKKTLEMENDVLKRHLHFTEETAKLSHALLEQRQKAVMRMQLGVTKLSHQSMGIKRGEIVCSSSNERGCATEPLEEDQQVEIDPELNFKTLAIDPPEKLM